MASARSVIHIVEKNPFAPRPFVFTEVAACLRDSIRASGYECEHTQNTVDPGALSILLGANPSNVGEFGRIDPARCAIFNFEQLGSTSFLATPEYKRWLAGWLVLDYHENNVAILKRENGSRQLVFEVPVVPSPVLQTPVTEPKSIDVLMFGTMSERRTHVVRELEAMGLKVEAVSGAYGVELAPAIRRARLVLHAHFYETGLFPVARFLQPVVMDVPVVCEDSVFSELNDWSHSGIVFAGYAHLAETCRDLLESPDNMEVRARRAHTFARDIDFAPPFLRAIQAFEAHALGARSPGQSSEGSLSDDEIAHILESEGAGLPPEPGAPVPPVTLAQHVPGKGIQGKLVLVMMLLFAAYMIWTGMQR